MIQRLWRFVVGRSGLVTRWQTDSLRSRPDKYNLIQPHAGAARFLIQMYGVDESHAPMRKCHRQSVRAAAIAKEADAVEQRAVRYSACGKDDLVSGREIVSGVNPLGILDAHPLHPLLEFLGIH